MISLVILFGPTGVGKTRLIETVFASGFEVINADSIQVYRDLAVGSARPSEELLARVPHHLVGHKDPAEQFDVGEFVESAEALIPAIARRGRTPLICGGTAFYLRTFLYGLPGTPKADAALRRSLEQALRRDGLDVLRARLAEVDPVSEARIAPSDAYRVLRALEVYESSGRPLSSFLPPETPRSDLRILTLGLARPRDELYRRIETRVDAMFEEGLVQEVRALLEKGYGPGDPGLRGIGYREFFTCAGDRVVDASLFTDAGYLREVRNLITLNTRRYAKRQMTFFRRIPGVAWLDADSPAVAGRVRDFLAAPSP